MRKVCGAHLLIITITAMGCSRPVMKRTATVAGEAYCSTQTSYPGSTTTVSGTAECRTAAYDSGNGEWNVTTMATDEPIRYAEVQVKDISGKIVQCTETDGNGDFTFDVPQGATYTVYINSRGFNSTVRASVLNLPSKNEYYSISKQFSASASTENLG